MKMELLRVPFNFLITCGDAVVARYPVSRLRLLCLFVCLLLLFTFGRSLLDIVLSFVFFSLSFFSCQEKSMQFF